MSANESANELSHSTLACPSRILAGSAPSAIGGDDFRARDGIDDCTPAPTCHRSAREFRAAFLFAFVRNEEEEEERKERKCVNQSRPDQD